MEEKDESIKISYDAITFLITLNVAIVSLIVFIVMMAMGCYVYGVIFLAQAYTNYIVCRLIKSMHELKSAKESEE